MSPDALHEPEARSLGEHAAEILPDLDTLAEQLQADSGEAFPGAEVTADLERERRELLGFARRAVEALRQCRGMEVRLMPDEEVGVQALLAFSSRPAILVQDGRFAEPPAAWKELDALYRSDIEAVLPSVGRVEVLGHPGLAWSGTAWAAAPGLVITNRHVVEPFAAVEAGERWRVQAGRAARIDFRRELGASPDEGRVFDVREDEPILVHSEHDLALVPVARTSRDGTGVFPPALSIAADGGEIREGRKVFVVGHPARKPPDRLLGYRFFRTLLDGKRLQPGTVMQAAPDRCTFLHDSSSLGDNSGAPVADLSTGRVLGLQSAGFHGPVSFAVALCHLADAPLLREAGVRFYGRD